MLYAAQYPDTALVKLGGRSFYVLHNFKELDLDPAAAGIDVVVSGHSHRPKIEIVGGVLYLNPHYPDEPPELDRADSS